MRSLKTSEHIVIPYNNNILRTWPGTCCVRLESWCQRHKWLTWSVLTLFCWAKGDETDFASGYTL